VCYNGASNSQRFGGRKPFRERPEEQIVTAFVVQQSDALFEARFASPAFMLLRLPAAELHQNVFRNLGKHGLTLGDIRIESGLPNLSDANATYTINVLNTLVRVWLDRLEVFFLDLSRIGREQVIEIAEAVLDAIQRTSPDIEMETYTATLTMHGTLQDTDLSQFISQYVKNAPEGLGSVLGRGFVYYFGPEADRRSASLVVDRSAAVSGAAFVRASVVFDGTELQMSHAPTAARDYVFKMLGVIGLDPSWEK
jgi:hypothetical protein